jgi:hypothetical protein
MKLNETAVCPGVYFSFDVVEFMGLMLCKPATNLSRERESHGLRPAVAWWVLSNQLRKTATTSRPYGLGYRGKFSAYKLRAHCFPASYACSFQKASGFF